MLVDEMLSVKRDAARARAELVDLAWRVSKKKEEARLWSGFLQVTIELLAV